MHAGIKVDNSKRGPYIEVDVLCYVRLFDIRAPFTNMN